MALEVGDMVLVHVTTFKGHHKIQDRWENREYVVEKWPYPDVPVYVVSPRDMEGCSQTLYRNYLLPINSNIGQDEKDAPVVGVENSNTSMPVPPVDSEPADAGSSGMVTPSEQVTHPRVVWINLLHLDMAHGKPRTNFHGGTGILVCWQLPVHPASGMLWLGCVSVFMLYLACTPFSGEVQCEYTLLILPHVCQALPSFGH